MRIALSASLVMAIVGVAEALSQHGVLAGTALLASLAMAAIPLRGPTRRCGPFAFGMAQALLAITMFVAVDLTFIVVLRFDDDAANLLLVAAFAISFLGIALWVGRSWLPRSHFWEAGALGLLALVLGSISLQGLRVMTVPVTMPYNDGVVLLYVSQPQPQPLALVVGIAPNPEMPAHVIVDVVNPVRNAPVSWALLMLGDARLSGERVTPASVSKKEITVRTSAGAWFRRILHGELLWGRLGAAEASEITGQTLSPLMHATTSHSAVSLPRFALGSGLEVDDKTVANIVGVLGAPITWPLRNGDFRLLVQTGTTDPVAEITQASPPLADPAELRWESEFALSPHYMTVDVQAERRASDYMFVLAVLLGVAGAALLGCFQVLLRDNAQH